MVQVEGTRMDHARRLEVTISLFAPLFTFVYILPSLSVYIKLVPPAIIAHPRCPFYYLSAADSKIK